MVERKSSQRSVLGEGSFGCVVSPPMECSGKKTKISDKNTAQPTVGKLFHDKKKYQMEFNLGKKMKKIDPSEKNILVPISGCPVSTKVLQQPENIRTISQCQRLESVSRSPSMSSSPNDMVWQEEMPYAGKDIQTALKKKGKRFSVPEFVKMVVPLFRAVVLLQNHKLVHQDIKVDNVLLHKNKAILIDFSLMMPFSDIYTLNNYKRLHRNYIPYPPEYYMASLLIQEQTKLQRYPVMVVDKYITAKFKNRLQDIQVYFRPYYSLEEITKLSNYNSLRKLPLEEYTSFANKIDVFSVGTVLTSLNEFLEEPTTHTEYVKLMRGILHPDPRKRMTSQEALALCEKIAT